MSVVLVFIPVKISRGLLAVFSGFLALCSFQEDTLPSVAIFANFEDRVMKISEVIYIHEK